MHNRSTGPFRVLKNAVVTWWDEWINWVLISILWLVSWITIVLGPPATFGLYYVSQELVGGQSLGVRGFLDGGKQFFLKAWGWMLVNLFVLIIAVANLLFYGQMQASWAVFVQGIFLLIIFLWAATQFYALPFFMLQEVKSLKMAWRNGFLTTLATPGFSLVLFLVVVVVLIPSVLFLIPLFLGIPGLVAVLGSFAVKDRVEVFRLRQQEGKGREGGGSAG
jgi:uncharacterized membrane protein YesL